MPKVALPAFAEDNAPSHPVLGAGGGPYAYQLRSDPGGLQFGAFIETPPPGSKSSFRHGHETEDEMVYILSGAVILVEDTETPLRAGDAASWPAVHPVGHCLENRSAVDASHLVIGTRNQKDIFHYPDHDLVTHKDGASRQYFHANGRHRPSHKRPHKGLIT